MRPSAGSCGAGCGCSRGEFAGVRAQADALLCQAAEFLEQISDETYGRMCPGAMDSTIGKHMRHILDHFAAPLGAAGAAMDVVDYDHRARNTPVETCRRTAGEAIRGVRGKLRGLSDPDLTRQIRVRFMLAADGSSVDLPTTLVREVSFASHHALHHFATIKIIADAFGEPTPEKFGMAPSTLNYEESEAVRSF